MNNLKGIRMEDHTMLVALISALGIKEIWNIWKKKLDLNAKKDEREDVAYTRQIEILATKIEQLELKIQVLIEENTQLLVKVARMEERIINNAKKRVKSKIKKDEKS